MKKRTNARSPYAKYGKRPYEYDFQTKAGRMRLANGDLKVKANDRKSNKYQ